MKLRHKLAFLVGCLTILLMASGCMGAKTKLVPGLSTIEKIEERKNPEGYKTKTTTIKIYIPGYEVEPNTATSKKRNTISSVDIDIIDEPTSSLMFAGVDGTYQLTMDTQISFPGVWRKGEEKPQPKKEGLVVVELPGGQKVSAPPGSIIEVTTEEKEPVGGSVKTMGKATAKGPGLTTSADSIDWSSFKTETPSVDLNNGNNGAHAQSGGMDYAAKGLKANSGPVILYVLGGLCIVAGVLLIALVKKVSLGLMIAAGGVAIIAVATLFQNYPWIVLVALGIGVAFAVYLIIAARKGKRIQDTLVAVVTGVENAPEPNAALVKASIKTESEALDVKDVVKSEVGKIKKTI